MSKLEKLTKLAQQRRCDNQAGLSKTYKQVGDFHDGAFDRRNHVSPWSNSACNVNSPLMIIAQDWTSEETAQKPPGDTDLGYSPELPTNKNLHSLLQDHFGLKFSDVYATNLFVFVKPGNLSSRIPMADLRYSALTYAVPQIQIVAPRVVLCLGSATFYALCKSIGTRPPAFKESIRNPVQFQNSQIFGIPHTGGFGTRNAGGWDKVNEIWQQLAQK